MGAVWEGTRETALGNGYCLVFLRKKETSLVSKKRAPAGVWISVEQTGVIRHSAQDELKEKTSILDVFGGRTEGGGKGPINFFTSTSGRGKGG